MSLRKNDAIYRTLSEKCRERLMRGDLQGYADALVRMAEIHAEEEATDDELKALMLMFYIRLSGCGAYPVVSNPVVDRIRELIAGKSKFEIDELYMSAVREDVTPRHIMTVNDSLYVLWLVLAGNSSEANRIVSRCCAGAGYDVEVP